MYRKCTMLRRAHRIRLSHNDVRLVSGVSADIVIGRPHGSCDMREAKNEERTRDTNQLISSEMQSHSLGLSRPTRL